VTAAVTASRKSVSRIFFCSVLAAYGGLTGWYLAALVSTSAVSQRPTAGTLFFQGGILGACIGLGAGVFDGIAVRSIARIVKFGGTSLLLGLFAGMVALPMAQFIYDVVGSPNGSSGGGSFLGAVICWVLFGGLIGIGEGISKGSQTWKALVGGMLGGVFGGGVYEAIGRAPSQGASVHEQAVLAFALTILGGGIGCAIALVNTVLKDAWLVIENGKLAGTEINISKYVHPQLGSRRAGIIGSSQWDANVYLPGDGGISPRHASISYVDGLPTLTALPESIARRYTTSVNGRPVKSWPLSNGDRLQIGSTTILYRHSR
jgi:hypothetical protein